MPPCIPSRGAKIRVWCGMLKNRPILTVENAGARICEDAIPHLFEALYRAESLPNPRAGGSGLVLYRRSLERHDAVCTIENTQDCARAAARVSEPTNRS